MLLLVIRYIDLQVIVADAGLFFFCQGRGFITICCGLWCRASPEKARGGGGDSDTISFAPSFSPEFSIYRVRVYPRPGGGGGGYVSLGLVHHPRKSLSEKHPKRGWSLGQFWHPIPGNHLTTLIFRPLTGIFFLACYLIPYSSIATPLGILT